MCRWFPESEGQAWEHGDYRFLIAEFGTEAGLAFVQIWSEPFDSEAIVEISSGRYGPLPLTALAPRKRARILRERGFSIPRSGRHNWSKTVGSLDESGCTAIAQEMLVILREAFGYDGSQALELTTGHSTRLVMAEVLSALRVDRLGQILRGMGIRIEREESADPADAWRCGTNAGHHFHAGLRCPVDGAEEGLFEVLSLRASAEEPCSKPEHIFSVLRDFAPFLSPQLLPDARLVLARNELLAGGVTPRAVQAVLRKWMQQLDAALAALGAKPATCRAATRLPREG